KALAPISTPVGREMGAPGDAAEERLESHSDVDAVIDLGRRIWMDMSPVENLAKVAATVMGTKTGA
ncbi:MAG: hypothetical protein KJ042_09905, partial [Deltaproteobacteria bacterium]|nr:hypothetical protein [Deltaproteobacteria bacterium]